MSLEDPLKISGVVNLYAVALDSQRYEILDAVFTPDVTVDFGGGFVCDLRLLPQSHFCTRLTTLMNWNDASTRSNVKRKVSIISRLGKQYGLCEHPRG